MSGAEVQEVFAYFSVDGYSRPLLDFMDFMGPGPCPITNGMGYTGGWFPVIHLFF